MKRVHILVSGIVHGVGFRHSIYSLALIHNVKGWIRNLNYNKLEAVFEGKKEDVDKLKEFCRKGPFLANVKNINIKEEKFIGEKSFKILK